MISTNYHTPVLLAESVEGLNIIEDGVYVDATYGGGGHSREILSGLGKKGQLIAFDQDFDSKSNLIDDNRLLFINENFMYLKKFLKLNNISKLDGILADFGVSSYQIDKPERGFSYRFEADLDMRMDNNSSLTAREIINKYTSEDLNKMFRNYGELNNAKKITWEIINNRKTAIETALEKMDKYTILLVMGKGREKYQKIKNEKLPHNDVQIIENFNYA